MLFIVRKLSRSGLAADHKTVKILKEYFVNYVYISQRLPLTIKGTFSRDGRGYKNYINQKVSLNPIKKSYFVKGSVHNLHLKVSALYHNISFGTTWFIPSCGVFPVTAIWNIRVLVVRHRFPGQAYNLKLACWTNAQYGIQKWGFCRYSAGIIWNSVNTANIWFENRSLPSSVLTYCKFCLTKQFQFAGLKNMRIFFINSTIWNPSA